MTTGEPEASGKGRPGRRVDVAVWALVIAALIGLAAAIAWGLSNVSVDLREITWEDDTVDVELLIPVAPAAEPAPSDRPPATPAVRAPEAGGVAPPVWTRQPAPFYPEPALRRGVERGEVALRCKALASGRLADCEVLRESPLGAGFAEAALASTGQARIEPRRIDGVRTDSRIAFTVRFQLAAEP